MSCSADILSISSLVRLDIDSWIQTRQRQTLRLEIVGPMQRATPSCITYIIFAVDVDRRVYPETMNSFRK